MSKKLPKIFKSILWSYKWGNIDVDESKRRIIINSVNYGDLDHWRWIVDYYGREEVLDVVNSSKEGEVREGAKKLLNLILSKKDEKSAYKKE